MSIQVLSRQSLELKPKNDKKDYVVCKLSTGLEIILVSTKNSKLSNPETSEQSVKSAAALSVQAGSFADPSDCEGLAHFVEHMLFMGSDKYPAENAYDAFVTAHGGSCNAMTEGEYTTYEFDISTTYFYDALDIFAHCFIHPLLSNQSIDRELKAIENEFNLARNDDNVKLQEIFALSSHPTSILRKFSWGNMYSLSTIPQQKGINIQLAARAFYNLHYKPSNAKLVLVSPLSIDVLLNYTLDTFGLWISPTTDMILSNNHNNNNNNVHQTNYTNGIKIDNIEDKVCSTNTCHLLSAQLQEMNNESEDDHHTHPPSKKSKNGNSHHNHESFHQNVENHQQDKMNISVPTTVNIVNNSYQTIVTLSPMNNIIEIQKSFDPILSEAYTTLHHVVSIKNVHKLHLSWCIDSTYTYYRSQPFHYISHLLGHEGRGSLLSCLKEEGLVTSLSAGVPSGNADDNSIFSIFWITITMTVKGVANWILIVRRIYEYIHMIRDQPPLEWIFKEIQIMGQLKFDYLDEENESDFAERLSQEMLPYYNRDRHDILAASFLLWDWKPEEIITLLTQMTPNRCQLYISSSLYDFHKHKLFDNQDSDQNKEESQSNGQAKLQYDDEEEEDGNSDGDSSNDDSDSNSSDGNDKSSADGEGSGTDDDDDDDVEDEDEESDKDEKKESIHKSWEEINSELISLYTGPKQWLPYITLCDSKKHHIEPRFHTIYWNTPLPSDIFEYWSQSSCTSINIPISLYTSLPSLAFHIPEPNIFLPTNFDIYSSTSSPGCIDNTISNKIHSNTQVESNIVLADKENEYQNQSNHPVKVFESTNMSVWYKLDTVFLKPKIEIFVKFSSSIPTSSIKHAVHHDLLIKMIYDYLTELLYVASLAELGCSFSRSDHSIIMRISGFHDKAHLFLQSILDNIFQPNAYIIESYFIRQKEILIRQYQNEGLKASSVARINRLLALIPSRKNSKEKLAVLQHTSDSITLKSLHTYFHDFFTTCITDVLVEGNMNLDGVMNIAHVIQHQLKLSFSNSSHTTTTTTNTIMANNCTGTVSVEGQKPHNSHSSNITHTQTSRLNDNTTTIVAERPQQSITKLLPTPHYILMPVIPENIHEKNICIEVYYQYQPYEILGVTRLDVLEQLIMEPFFDTLRTKQQLGYSVSCGVRDTYGITGFGFQIISSTHTMNDILKALFQFIHNIPIMLLKQESKDFIYNIQALIHMKKEPFLHLSDITEYHWTQIDDRRYNFTFREDLVTILEDSLLINQEIMSQFAETLFLSTSRRLMIVQASVSHECCVIPTEEIITSGNSGNSCSIYDPIIIQSPSEIVTLPNITQYPSLI